MILKYILNSNHFNTSLCCRIYLAILHYNENADRPQARRHDDGELQWMVVYPRAKKGEEAVLKPVKEKLTYGMLPIEENQWLLCAPFLQRDCSLNIVYIKLFLRFSLMYVSNVYSLKIQFCI